MVLKKSYKEILKDPASFKKNLIIIIRDINARLKKLESGEILMGIFSRTDHNHDLQYARIYHSHDERYSQITHTHEEYLTSEDTIDNALHLNGKEDTDFALKSHSHDRVCYMATFSVDDTTGNFPIKTKYPVNSTNNVIFMEDYFNAVAVDNEYVIIEYDVPEDKINNVFHMMYWVENSIDGKRSSSVSMNDITGNLGEEVTLYSVIRDENNSPVSKGEFEYEIIDE